jgi:hypothetical protein
MAHKNIDERREAVKEMMKGEYTKNTIHRIARQFGCSSTAVQNDVYFFNNEDGATLYPCPSLKKYIFKRDNNTCQYCGITGVFMIAEHVIPISLGGVGKDYNLVCACQKCNSKKVKGVAIPNNIETLKNINHEWYNKIKKIYAEKPRLVGQVYRKNNNSRCEKEAKKSIQNISTGNS